MNDDIAIWILYRFVLVKFLQDTIVQPIDTEWFQFYVPNQDKNIQAFSESNAAVSMQSRSHVQLWKRDKMRERERGE